MKKKLDKIRSLAISTRERLSYGNVEDQKHINKLDRIIRGAVFVRWIFLLSIGFFALYAIVGPALVYPKVEFMLIFIGFALCGFTVSWLGVLLQIKLWRRTISKIQLVEAVL